MKEVSNSYLPTEDTKINPDKELLEFEKRIDGMSAFYIYDAPGVRRRITREEFKQEEALGDRLVMREVDVDKWRAMILDEIA